MSKKARILVHPDFQIGEISPKLYGAFLEPIGTMVNGSMYNPKHPAADDKGFRRDWLEALKASGLPAVRLPGGNFVSGWDWKDSIGPMAQRKTRLDPAWRQYIPNDVGHDEYLLWAERAGTEAMYTINLGTGDINDAMKIIEYTNHESGSYWSDLRREYGRETPYGVKTWYLGNEMDGPWQIGSWMNNPKGYGALVNEVSRVMKMIDGSIETVVCGSTAPTMPDYPQWDAEVLQQCYGTVDYVSLHYYHSAPPGDYAALLGGSRYVEDYINTVIAVCDFVKAQYRSTKSLMISFDEYGAFPREPQELNYGRNGRHNFLMPHYSFAPGSKYIRHDPDNMQQRRFRRGYDMINAVTTASTILAFLRRADRVKIGCMTGGLHAIAAADREHVWRAASSYTFEHFIKYGRGTSLKTIVDCDTYDIPGYAMNDNEQMYTQKNVGFIDTAAAYDEEKGELAVFAVNRNWEEDTDMELETESFKGYNFIEHIELYSDNIEAGNTYESPDAVVPSVNTNTQVKNGRVSANLKKLSWNVFRFKKTK